MQNRTENLDGCLDDEGLDILCALMFNGATQKTAALPLATGQAEEQPSTTEDTEAVAFFESYCFARTFVLILLLLIVR